MRKSKKKERAYRSIQEVEKAFFPESFRRRQEESMDLPTLATRSAEESLKKVRRHLKE